MPEEEFEEIEQEEIEQHEETHSKLPHYTHEDYLRAQKITFADVRDALSGPIISLIIHVILISFVGTLVVYEQGPERTDVVVEMKDLDLPEMEEVPEPPKPPEQTVNDIQIEIDRPEVNTNSGAIEVDNIAVADDISVDIQMPQVLTVRPGKSVLRLPVAYKMRSGAARKKAMKLYGVNLAAEKSVDKALAWLAKNQNPDGSWGVNGRIRPAMTAFAALAFMANGQTPQSQKYGTVLIKAIKALIKDVNGIHKNRGYIGSGDDYTHAIVAYALSEAYGITKIPKVKEAMNKAVNVLIERITKDGSYYFGYAVYGWDMGKVDPYTGRPKEIKINPRGNLSFAGWNYQALKAAYSAGCNLEGLQETIDLAINGLKKHHVPEAGFRDNILGGASDIGVTYVGALCMGLFGEGHSKETREAMKWLKEQNARALEKCSWRYDKSIHKHEKSFTWALYSWYYQTQLLFQVTKGRGSLWDRWNKSFSKAFVDEQNPDGSWLPPAQKYGQHLDPKKTNAEWTRINEFKEEKDLKVYATCLCCLTLQVYCRYLPTFKLQKSFDKKEKKLFDSNEKLDLGLNLD